MTRRRTLVLLWYRFGSGKAVKSRRQEYTGTVYQLVPGLRRRVRSTSCDFCRSEEKPYGRGPVWHIQRNCVLFCTALGRHLTAHAENSGAFDCDIFPKQIFNSMPVSYSHTLLFLSTWLGYKKRRFQSCIALLPSIRDCSCVTTTVGEVGKKETCPRAICRVDDPPEPQTDDRAAQRHFLSQTPATTPHRHDNRLQLLAVMPSQTLLFHSIPGPGFSMHATLLWCFIVVVYYSRHFLSASFPIHN